MQIEFCRKKGIRVDRVIQAEVLKTSQTLNKTIKIGCQYKLAGDSRWLHSGFKLDVINQGKKKLTWLH